MDYLYYKLHRVMLKSSMKDIAEYMAAVAMGGLFGVNLVVINAFLAKLDMVPFLYRSSAVGGGFTVLLMLVIGFVYLNGKKYVEINEKYHEESDSDRVKGNLIVALYVTISFVSIFLVAFFKPGYLPK